MAPDGRKDLTGRSRTVDCKEAGYNGIITVRLSRETATTTENADLTTICPEKEDEAAAKSVGIETNWRFLEQVGGQ